MTDRIDIHSPEFTATMHTRLRELRDTCPVSHSDAMGGFWAVTRYEDVTAVARQAETFCSSQGVTLPRVGHVYDPIPLEADPPDHSPYRKILQPLFSRQAVQRYEPELREFVRATLDELGDKRETDMLVAIAEPVPLAALSLVLGVAEEHRPTIRHLTESLLAASGAGRREEAAEWGRQFFAFLADQLTARVGATTDDALTIVANAEIDGVPLTEAEKLGMAYLLLVAGHHTTVHAIGTALGVLAQDAALRRRLIDDAELVPQFVEEALRWETSVPCMARTATTDTVIGDQPIHAGDRLMLFFTSANHDDRKFPNADRFDIDRTSNPHVTFGFGPHRCQGEHVARLELTIVVEEVLARMPDLSVAPGAELEYRSGYGRGLRELPVVW